MNEKKTKQAECCSSGSCCPCCKNLWERLIALLKKCCKCCGPKSEA